MILSHKTHEVGGTKAPSSRRPWDIWVEYREWGISLSPWEIGSGERGVPWKHGTKIGGGKGPNLFEIGGAPHLSCAPLPQLPVCLIIAIVFHCYKCIKVLFYYCEYGCVCFSNNSSCNREVCRRNWAAHHGCSWYVYCWMFQCVVLQLLICYFAKLDSLVSVYLLKFLLSVCTYTTVIFFGLPSLSNTLPLFEEIVNAVDTPTTILKKCSLGPGEWSLQTASRYLHPFSHSPPVWPTDRQTNCDRPYPLWGCIFEAVIIIIIVW